MDRPSKERIEELLLYVPETGDFFWRVTKSKDARAGDLAGCVLANGYRVIGIDGRRYRAHHLAWVVTHGYWPKELDHRNRDRDDNRPVNLRDATRGQNLQNRRMDRRNKSGFIGVSWDKQREKWHAKICVNYKQKSLGFYDAAEQAAEAYKKAKAELHTFHPEVRN